jgi:hypothetical protein
MPLYNKTGKRDQLLSEKPAMIITFVICLTCWGIHYFYSAGFPTNNIGKTLINNKIAHTVGLLSVLVAGFAIQRISDREMFVRERTRFPFMLFLLFFSTNADLLPVGEATIVIFCFIALLYELFKSYQTPNATVRIFNAGLYLGFASLFVPQLIVFIPLMWIGMYDFRALEWKSFLASFIGVLTVYWILLGWCVWKHDFSPYTKGFEELFHVNLYPVASLFQYSRLATLGIMILAIVSCFYVKTDLLNNKVRTRMMLSFLVNMTVLLVILTFLYSDKADIFEAILYLSTAVLITCFFETAKLRIKFILVLYYFMLILLLFSFIVNVWKF